MRISSFVIIGLTFLLHASMTVRVADPVHVLVFSKTKGWKHTSIPFGIAAIQKLGKENNFLVDTTKNAAVFTDENLKKYATVIFNNTTGNVLNGEQQAAFERYIQAGGGYVGITRPPIRNTTGPGTAS